uniref:Uncharacterized protein n=1 Tax=Panagrolaimus sp. JU765 TaxID=591449 RepID=A0AC34QSI3_9BILA
MNQNVLNMIVNDVITRPPDLPQSLMADVNPKLVEAMRLLDEGVSWTHPAILSVLVLIRQHAQATAILNQYQQQQQQQLSPIPVSEHYSSPAPESVTSRSSEKSTEELMRSLTPDEYLAVNVLTEMADAF